MGVFVKFLDLTKIYVRSGKGGDGCVSFRREKYLEYGGPDGGDGGNGGHVWVQAVEGLNTLIDFRYQQHFFAKNGGQGMGKQRSGRRGDDIIIRVPLGTEILDEDGKTIIADVVNLGDKTLLAPGGNGGWGNLRFKTSTNQAPRKANLGLNGVERTLWLKLKLIADVGIFGLPNAGKSTFLASNSNAKPKIADYPFTTLFPNLGVVNVDNSELVFADIPGLIKGAHLGKGIGIRFLGHVERAAILIHLLDGTSKNLVADYKTVRRELSLYGGELKNKRSLVVVNKIDALDKKSIEKIKNDLTKVTSPVHFISAVSGNGVEAVLRSLNRFVVGYRKDQNLIRKASVPSWHP